MAHSSQVNEHEQITWQTDTTTNNSSCNRKGQQQRQQQHATSTSSLKKLAKKQKALDCSSSNERNSANATLHLNVAKQKNRKNSCFLCKLHSFLFSAALRLAWFNRLHTYTLLRKKHRGKVLKWCGSFVYDHKMAGKSLVLHNWVRMWACWVAAEIPCTLENVNFYSIHIT